MDSTAFVNGMFGLEGHVGIVTGASRGLGKSIASRLVEAGAKVYNLDVISPDEKVENVVDIQVDLTDRVKTREVIDTIATEEGQLDFLVNNAGITFKSRAEDFPIEKYRKIQDINLETVFELSRMCYPYLKGSEYIGRIVSISSMAAHMGFTDVVPYCITKSGVTGLTRGLAEEWKHDNIRVNSVAPGWVLTKLNAELFDRDPSRKEAAASKIMLGEFGTPEDIGNMVLFLLGNASSYLTGQDFAVDGGALTHGF